MNAQHFARAHPILMSIAFALLCMTLLGCKPKPQSMFERQAEGESAQEIGATINDASDTKVAIVDDARPTTSKNLATSNIEIIKQQALARQPNCDIKPCQYFELNIVDFSPKQPWLTSIMWQTIAHVLAPEMPLASQDEAAKKIILMLLNQIEYGEGTVSTLPMYQRIDTEVVFNPVSDLANIDSTPTGYLAIRSSVSKDDSHEQFNYIMLDMQKKLQLNIEDILLPEATPDELLATFQTAKKDWLTLQGVEAQYLDDWPLQLSEQWYLDKEGLHMVYQSGELLEDNAGAVDLLVPYVLLQKLLKPSYRVYSK
ncbi:MULTISPECIES: hypothetical protein [unclassified Psychrobacter]|uniref:hypothetical protein n=1 Tax=unclassified Psychrobacter TaxID=196806 RepID=UPI003FD2EB27